MFLLFICFFIYFYIFDFVSSFLNVFHYYYYYFVCLFSCFLTFFICFHFGAIMVPVAMLRFAQIVTACFFSAPITAFIFFQVPLKSLVPKSNFKAYFSSNQQEPENSYTGLNPFSDNKRPSFSALFSRRQKTLQHILSDLIDAAQSDDEMRAILLKHENFLMEQFDEDTFLEPESIFTSEMDRFERFDRYNAVMAERIIKAQNPKVKKVLKFMANFVSDHDVRQKKDVVHKDP